MKCGECYKHVDISGKYPAFCVCELKAVKPREVIPSKHTESTSAATQVYLALISWALLTLFIYALYR